MTSPVAFATFDSPLGPIRVEATDQSLLCLAYGASSRVERRNAVVEQIEEELSRYFAGRLVAFETEIDPQGTPFQRRVWKELLKIPSAETRSYAQIARAIGSPKALRAVGTANGANPLAILVPCHRVVRTGGALGGYSGGIDKKRWLLEHEQAGSRSLLFA